MNQAVLGYEQKFFINGTQISGVQSVQGSYGIDERPINVLGWGHVNNQYYGGPNHITQNDDSFILDSEGFHLVADGNTECGVTQKGDEFQSMALLNSPMEGSFSINSVLVGQDFLLNLTGDNPFTGSIHYDNRHFGFSDGYITNHSVSCSVGQLPSTSTSIRVFGDIGGSPDLLEQEQEDGAINNEEGFGLITEDSHGLGYNASGDNSFPEIRLPNQGSIVIECNGTETDRVTSFNHSINIGVSPIYKVGSAYPVQVDVEWPIDTTTSFSLDIDKYKYQSLRKYLRSPTLKDISIKINDCFGDIINEYSVNSARLISEDMSASTDGRMTVNLSYKSYYNKR